MQPSPAGTMRLAAFCKGLMKLALRQYQSSIASTTPSGKITRETCDELIQTMFTNTEVAGRLDGALTAPHGASVGEGNDYRDFDGHWLTRLRQVLGPDTPIIFTIDPHANLSPRMIEA